MRPITVKEVAETVKKLIGDVEIEHKEERPGDFEGKKVSAEKAKSSDV
jgi:nucleoside-diphosphate-sugar epimerase